MRPTSIGDSIRCSPITQRWMQRAQDGMRRHGFRRGCLVGNLSQELGAHDERLRPHLQAVLARWEARVADLLAQAQACGQLRKDADPAELARFFWIGWQGAIVLAKLKATEEPLMAFGRTLRSVLAAHAPGAGPEVPASQAAANRKRHP
jgi:TetR/AcrR family transcriptional regulator, transcriptional repressor for nem operon